MAADLTPFRGSRLPREVQQAIEYQDQTALVRARRIRNIGMAAELGVLTVVSLTRLESEAVKMNPGCELRVDAVVNVAAGAIAAEISRLAMGQ